MIYENGYPMPNNESLPLPDALNDKSRVAFLHDYLESLLTAIRKLDCVGMDQTLAGTLSGVFSTVLRFYMDMSSAMDCTTSISKIKI
jgi:hypothetical protein